MWHLSRAHRGRVFVPIKTDDKVERMSGTTKAKVGTSMSRQREFLGNLIFTSIYPE